MRSSHMLRTLAIFVVGGLVAVGLFHLAGDFGAEFMKFWR